MALSVMWSRVLILVLFCLLFLIGELGYEYLKTHQAMNKNGLFQEMESSFTVDKQRARIEYEKTRLKEATALYEHRKKQLTTRLSTLMDEVSAQQTNPIHSVLSRLTPERNRDSILANLSSEGTESVSSVMDILLTERFFASETCGHFGREILAQEGTPRLIAQDRTESQTPAAAAQSARIRVKVFAGIFSQSSNFARRDIIRNTVLRDRRWSMDQDHDIQVKFVVGDEEMYKNSTLSKLLQREKVLYKDIILFESIPVDLLVDGLANGERTRLFFHYAYANYDLDHLVKMDDAAFVRLPQLVRALEVMPKRWMYWGHIVSGQRVITDPTHPFSDPTYLSVNDRYPAYATSAGFALTRDILSFLVLSMLDLRVWAHDDAMVGTWLSPVDIGYVDVGFDFIWRAAGCLNCYCDENSLAIVHPVNNDTLYESLYRASTEGELCTVELFHRRVASRIQEAPIEVEDKDTTNAVLLVICFIGVFVFFLTITGLVLLKVMGGAKSKSSR